MVNSYSVVGMVLSSPVLRQYDNGTTRLGFELAVAHRWQNQRTQEMHEETSHIDVVAWSSLAENVAATISKGMRVVVIGRVEQFSYDKDFGESQSILRVTAEEVSPSLRRARAEVTRCCEPATN